MTKEERELSIEYLEGIKDNYIEGHGYERHPVPEYYAIENAIKALEQQAVLDKIFNIIYPLSIMSTSELEHKAIMQIAKMLEPLFWSESEENNG